MATGTNERSETIGRPASNQVGEIVGSVPSAITDSIRLSPYRWAAAAAIVLGVGLRLVGYLQQWPLNIDDARLAINIASRSPLQLIRPLDFEQSAPLPLLWMDWGLTRVFGANEYALRTVPLVAGALLLVLLWHLARTILGERQGAVAAILAAGAPLLVFYGGAYSIKQYGLDAFVAVVVLVFAAAVVRDPTAARSWLRLAVAGVIAEWVSQASVFVLAGVGLAVLVALPSISQRGRVVRWMAAVGSLWAGVFLILYITMYRPVAHNPYMVQFWGLDLTDAGESSAGRHWWLTAYRAWVLPLVGTQVRRFAVAKLAAACAVVGFGLVGWRRGARWAAFLAGPLLFLAMAIALHAYPSADRLMLFAVPCFILFLAEVVACGVDCAPRAARGPILASVLVAFAALALVFGPAVAQAHFPKEDARRLVEHVREASPSEPVYVLARGVPAWVFYSTDWRRPDQRRIRWIVQVTAALSGPAFENAASRGRVVRNEGDTLVDVYAGRREVIGLGSGLALRESIPLPPTIDTGWADNEVRRMRLVAAPTVWLFASHYDFDWVQPSQAELPALLAAASRAGATIMYSDIKSEAALYRLRFGT